MQSVLTELSQHICLEQLSNKVVVVKGDLSRPNLDLHGDDYKMICNSYYYVIIHNGAVGRSKFIHYVSTVGVFAPEILTDPISEESDPSPQDRPGLIGPHSSTGDANHQDWVCWLVRGLAKLKKYPEGPGCNEVIHFIPVDYVAKAVVYFSIDEQGQRLLPRVFHLANDMYPVPYSKLIEILKKRFFPQMESSNYVEFRALLTRKARSLDDSVLCSLDLLLPHTARIIEVRKMLEEMMAKDVSNHLMVPGLLQLQGLYETMVMPFGLCNAPATLQRLVHRMLNDLKWTECLVYFDDIVVDRQCGWDLSNSTEAVPTQVGLVLPLPFQLLSPKVMRDLQLAGPSVSPVMTAVAKTQKPLPDEVKNWRQKGRRLI
eukprot:Em0007g1455a